MGSEFGVEKSILICHSLGAKRYADEKFPGRFVYAKYFSGSMRFVTPMEDLIREIKVLREEGYHMAKMQSAPVMRGRTSTSPEYLRMDGEEMARFFDAMMEEDIPFMLHLSDPDTYYASRYTDKQYYTSKERDLNELEGVLKRYGSMKLQLAHFAAQPEIHRLDNLARWFDTYPNFNIDTSSARWMSRELSSDSKKAREFFIKYQDRIHFGTDCVSWGPERNYYEGRYLALRLLLETDQRDMPLPFTDSDTVDTGGTFINGLDLPDSVLRKLYWDNVHKFYEFL
ncbi:MAG: amidohydrolase family protein [Candidatus Thorarchaeota archaeon]